MPIRLWIVGAVALCTLLLVITLDMPSKGAQALPGTLKFLTSGNMSLTVENVAYTPGTPPNGPFGGTGDLLLRIGGKEVFRGVQTPFEGVVADAAGNVQTNATGYAFKKDVVWNNAFGTGTDVILVSGFRIVLSNLSNPAAALASIRGVFRTLLPFRTGDGGRSELRLDNSALDIGASGRVRLDGDAISNGKPLTFGGFAIAMAKPHITLQQPTMPLLQLRSQTVTVQTPLPNLLTKNPLVFQAADFAVDENGLPSFSNLTIAQTRPPMIQVATVGKVTLGAAAAPSIIAFEQPAGFGFEAKMVAGSVRNGAFESLALSGDLLLPTFLTNAGLPARIQGVTVDPFTPSFKRNSAAPLTFGCKPADVPGAEFLASISQFEIDPKQGLRKITGTLQARLAGGMPILSANGQPLTLGLTDWTLDGAGMSGAARLSNANLLVGGLRINNAAGEIAFDNGNVTGGRIEGLYGVPGLGNIRLNIGVTGTGVSVAVLKQKGLSWGAFGAAMEINGGTASIKNGIATLLLDGFLTFPKDMPWLKDATLEFQQLGIDSQGRVQVQELALKKPVSLDLGPVAIQLTRFGYTTQGGEAIRLNGDVKFPDSLPIAGTVGFEGLTIRPGRKISIGGISAEAAIAGVGRIGFGFTPPSANNGLPDANGFRNAMKGSASLALDMLPVGIDCGFLIADDAWMAIANVPLPPPGIPLPVPPPPFGPYLYIVGFRGGAGYGVRMKDNPNWGGGRTLDNYSFFKDQWMIQAGTDISTLDQTTLWGPLTLTVGFPEVEVRLRGDAALLTPRPLGMDPSRKAYLDIGWYGSFFRATGGLTYGLSPFYKASGGLEMLFSETDGYCYVGWPLDQRGIGVDTLVGGAKGGVGLDFYRKGWKPGETRLMAAFEKYGDLFGILKGRMGGEFRAMTFNTSLSLFARAYADGAVDFGVAELSAGAEASGEVRVSPKLIPLESGSLRGKFRASIGALGARIPLEADVTLLNW